MSTSSANLQALAAKAFSQLDGIVLEWRVIPNLVVLVFGIVRSGCAVENSNHYVGQALRFLDCELIHGILSGRGAA